MYKIIVSIILCSTISLLASENKFDIKKNILNESAYQQNISPINKILTCSNCCFSMDKILCNIFYLSCKNPVLRHYQFFYSNKNVLDSNILLKIKNNVYKIMNLNKTILFTKRQNIYFLADTYEFFSNTMLHDLHIIKEEYSLSNNDEDYNNNERQINEYLNIGKKQQFNENKLNKLSFKSFNTILASFDDIINKIDTHNRIIIYNTQLESYCKNKKTNRFQPLTTSRKKTTDLLQTVQSENSFSMSTTMVVAIVVGTLFIIVVIAGVIIYKFYLKKPSKNKIKTNNSDKTLKKGDIYSEHVYEDPDVSDKNIENLQEYKQDTEVFVNLSENINNNIAINDSEQNFIPSNIIIASRNVGNKPVTVIVVEPDKYKIIATKHNSIDCKKKAILINLPEKIETNDNDSKDIIN